MSNNYRTTVNTTPPNHLQDYPILTAAEFVAQGTSAGAIMSIGESLASQMDGHVQQHILAGRVRRIAEEVAALTGQTLQIPAAVTNARTFARYKGKRAHNDNYRGNKRRVA